MYMMHSETWFDCAWDFQIDSKPIGIGIIFVLINIYGKDEFITFDRIKIEP